MNKTAALDLVRKGNGKLPEIVSVALAPTEAQAPDTFEVLSVAIAPNSAVLEAVRDAVVAAAEVAPVTVTERRRLDQDEVNRLMKERIELDEIEKYIKARKDAMKTMVFNHLDIDVEEAGAVATPDSKGHYLAKGEVVSNVGHRFTRELRSGSPTVTAEALEDLVESGTVSEDVFSHEDYLACTTQVRVLDEEKTLLHMRKRPEIVEALAAAAVPGKTTASLNRRK